jgi:predicted Fe-S protein YdhL (DUF1289 family)
MSDEIQSPCVDLCIMDDGVCTGCGMTQQESTNWPKMTDAQRRKVIERLEQVNKSQ